MINKKELLRIARAIQICDPSAQDIMQAGSIEELLQLYLSGLDFCLNHNFPSNDYLLQHGGELLEKHGIYVNGFAKLVNPKKAVLLGHSLGDAEIKDYQVSELFIKHKGIIVIRSSGNSITTIDAFDDAEINVLATDRAQVQVNLYANASVKSQEFDNAKIKIIHKNKDKY